jgi:aminopeptidase N
MQSGKKDMARLALEHYHQASNYTDRMTALTLITHQQVEGFEDLLGAYFTEWQDNALVINKWLSIQATIPSEDTLHRVRQLMELPVFSLKNPNAVRSLIGAFCGGNVTRFHAKDGSGYAFLADQVIALDALNPQIASRLVSLFNDFRQYNAETRQAMLKEMQRIHAVQGISANVFEIVEKALKSDQ